jgi:feruloyl esterase
MRLIAAILALLSAGFAPANRQANPAAQAVAPAPAAARCVALARQDWSTLPDTPAVVTAATLVPGTSADPAYCRVEGYVAPQVGFEVHVPVDGWNGKYLQQGCGGMCGWLNMGACADALARGYAVANTDMGHKGPPASARWAQGNRQAQIDFGWRATHVLAVVGKAVAAGFYGKAPVHSYFRGCSTGGRQALIEAQQFPADFDGIIAGAPVLNETGDGVLHLLWSGRAAVDASGRPVLSAVKVELLHRAVVAACDGRDGVRDGILMEPTTCPWRPAALACRGTDGADCLNPAELRAAEAIYAGAHDSAGRRLFPGGMTVGSEYQWVPAFVGTGGQPPLVLDERGLLPDFIRFLALEGEFPGLLGFDWDRDTPRIRLKERLFNAQNPDLRDFQRLGGKLIMYHGWDDLEIPPGLTIDYWTMVERTMGGPQAVRPFARLFMVPGMAHCRRGHGADAVDWLAALEDWVERGRAPDSVMAHHLVKEQNYLGLPVLRFPLDRAAWDWARPVAAWPAVARYDGRGDWRDPASWRVRQ